jgi:Ca-activated chloride channel family protein
MQIIAFSASAQSNDRDHIRMGNRHYRSTQYQKAETNYRKAIDKKSSMEAYNNLGNALALQGKDSTAFEMYKKALDEPSPNTLKKAQIYHNMGNLTYANGVREMKMGGQNATQSFQQAVDLFKSSLRLNPDDNETRYNLAMAQYQLKKSQENQQQNQNQNQQQQQQQQQQDQQKQDQQDKKDEQQQQPPQQDKDQIDDKTAQQLLNSAQQDEKNVQRKVQQNPQQRRSLEKDW